jgi:2-desacetyl-2-hydroxyethyl bacteriochlorophyllide A dehydrogenase
MKAALLKNWNELALTDIAKPTINNTEALIKVRYGGICGSDITVYSGKHPTAIVPVVLCHEILGTIEELPSGYKGKFDIGARVLMNPVISCGTCNACKSGYYNVCANLKLLGIHVNGGFAEYTKVNVDKLVKVSPSISDKVAALGEPFAVAYHVNSRAGIQAGEPVLIIGAGTIGIVVALVARELGALVTISEINPERLQLAANLGFGTINSSKVDIMAETKKLTNGDGFDVVCDASGSKAGALMLPDLGRIGGKLLSLGLSGLPCEFVLGKVSFKEQTLNGSRLYSQEHFMSGIKMLEAISRKYDLSSIISDEMPLSQIVEGFEKMKAGKNVGKILIKCN